MTDGATVPQRACRTQRSTPEREQVPEEPYVVHGLFEDRCGGPARLVGPALATGVPFPRRIDNPVMAKKKRGEELLLRTATLSLACPNVSVGASERRGEPPRIGGHHWLIFRGTLDEPVKNVREVQFTIHGEEHPEPRPAKPASVGAVVHMRPHMTVAMTVPAAEFDRLWTAAALIKHAYFRLTKPHYGTALVTSAMFSSEPIE